VLFNNVKGKPNHRVLTNLFGDIKVINKMFGWKDDAERVKKLAYALSHPLKPVEIPQDEAPCQEHVIENPKDVNEHVVPIRHTTYEPELTVGSAIRCVTGPEFDGGSDLGYNRMNFRWGNVGTFQISPGSHMWQVVNKYYKSDEPVPITMCFGVPPACTLARGRRASTTPSADGLRRDRDCRRGAGHADPLVKARTVNAMALAGLRAGAGRATSIRATGASRPRNRRMPASRAASTSIRNGRATWARPTRRRPSTSPASPCAIPRPSRSSSRSGSTPSTTTTSIPPVREAAIYELCDRLQPGIVQNVVIPYCMTDWGGCIIQVKKRHQLDEAGSATSWARRSPARRACGW
jgi:4-hydroxy-3-polyprenylbenzoate decarboxylase